MLQFFKRLFTRSKEQQWNKEYARGTWDSLKSPLEEERFQALRLLITKYSRNSSILEVGCGEGILQSTLPPHLYSDYLGIDISQVAIQKAAYLQNPVVHYCYADMEKFVPPQSFDIIIFSETLYYATNPLGLMQQYMEYLRPEGIMIVSVFENPRNKKAMSLINSSFPYTEEIITSNEKGKWYCRVHPR